MRALVVYESMYGNTHVVADHIAEGLRSTFEVTVVPVGEATADLVAASDLIVVGGPTHAHGLSSRSTRAAAARTAEKEGSGLSLDAAGSGLGLRDWFHRISAHRRPAAAFDTRFDAPVAFTGRASRGIGRRLRRHGFRLVAHPESFLIDKQNRLLDGEAARATSWGAALAAAVGAASHT